MRISEITDKAIVFDNCDAITFGHEQECCEHNYADFAQVDDIARAAEFEQPLQFEACDYGFRFGDSRQMFFCPCYSCQNGYYSNDVEIYYNGKLVLNADGQVDDTW